MSSFAPTDSVLGRISSLLEELDGQEKRAAGQVAPGNGATKRADETTLGHSGQGSRDPGGRDGPSSHPSAKVDSNTQSTPIGSRFKENHDDMTDQYAVGNVDRSSKGGGGSQDDKQIQQGTQQSATGEEPKVEDNYKGTKDDPGTSSPVNAEETGHKYGSMQVGALTKLAYERMNECLADMANGVHLKQAAAPQQQHQQPNDPALAAQAGYQLAAAAAQAPDFDYEKTAAVQEMLAGFIKTAEEDADLVAEYLIKYAAECERQGHQKQGEGPPPPMPPGGADPGGGGMPGGMPPGMPPGMDAGGGGPPGGGPPPDMGGGGPPPPDMAGGGPPGAGGGGDQHEAINELANALMELGISPEELIAAMHGGGGGGGGEGGPPGGGEGGGPPDMGGGEKGGSARLNPQERQQVVALMQKVAAHQRAGRMRIKEARPGQERAERDEIKGYLLEVCAAR
jgi:hypothetical protein